MTDRHEKIQAMRNREQRVNRQEKVKAAIEHGNRDIADGDYDHLATVVFKRLLPALDLNWDNVYDYDDELHDSDMVWSWENVELALDHDNADYWCGQSHDDLRTVFYSLQSAAVYEGIIVSEVEEAIPVYEYEQQVGERLLPALSSTTGDQMLIKPFEDGGDFKFTLCVGGTGSAKSSSLETIAHDRLSLNRRDNPQPWKIIDVHDTEEAENVLWDVPEDGEYLRGIRDGMGLKPALDGDEYDLEVLVPLTNTLEDSTVTVRKDGTSPATVFAIPACELSKSMLQMMVDQTAAQRKYVSDAYDKVRDDDDWTLGDLANAVRETGARADVQDRIIKSLHSLQQKSYIRDRKSDYVLDWEAIMRDTGTITAVSTMMMEDEAEALMVTTYVINKLYEERMRLKREHKFGDLPAMSLVIRELQELAPHNLRKDERVAAIQRYATARLQKIGMRHRHYKMELLCDAQKFKIQLDEDVRTYAHRIFRFKGQYPNVKECFKIKTNATNDVVIECSNYETGTCALVDGNGRYGYTKPIKMAPPPSRHLEVKRDGDGWQVRAELVPGEELGRLDVDATVPERLQFEVEQDVEDAETPVAEFARECIETGPQKEAFLFSDDVFRAWQTYAMTNGLDMHTTKSTLMEEIKNLLDLTEDDKSRRKYSEDSRKWGYWGITWTDRGLTYHDLEDDRHNLDAQA